MYETGRNPDPNSKESVEISSGLASTSFPRHEENRPFPPMAPTPPLSARPNSTSPSTLSRDASGERDANGNFGSHYSTEQSPSGASGVHPGEGNIFNFTQNEGSGPVRLTHMTPISPTNEDVYSSEQLQRNPQPPISNSFLQVLSPSRPGTGTTFPYLFTGGPPIFTMQENEKYRKLMLKKQKRVSKKEKNVLNVFNAEDVEGHKGITEDIDSVLQSLGEKVEKKGKVKKPKEKIDNKTKSEKRERARKSAEKELGHDDEDKTDDDEKPGEEASKLVINKVRNKFVEDELMSFKDKFYLVTPEPGPLSRHKSRDCLAGSVESLPTNTSSPSMSFTKVTSKKHRTKRSKEESGKPPPGPVVQSDCRKGGYALRSREIGSANTGREQTSSPTESVVTRVEQSLPSQKPSLEIPSLEGKDFPKLVQDDFPALPGGGMSIDPIPALPSAWSRAVTKTSDSESGMDRAVAKKNDNEDITDTSSISETNCENEDLFKDTNACDFEAVIDSTVPKNSVCIDIEGSVNDIEDIVEEGIKTDLAFEDEEEVTVTKTDIAPEVTTLLEEEPSTEDGSAYVKSKIDNIEVVTSEDEFNRRKADNSAPVVIFSENDQDWTSAEFTFGFDINEDLVANSSSPTFQDLTTPQPQQLWTIPAPLTPIDTVDGAILSFGGPDPMRMIVPVAVGVPVPVSGMAADHLPLPFYPHQFPNGVIPPFRAFPMSFGHQMAPQGLVHQQYQEDELELGEKGDDTAGEDHTISPESGISSASPLSWQPDSSPSLPAPGSYPHDREAGRDNPAPLPLASQVSQSLSNWQGHSVHSDSSESDRSSPAPGWATQVEIEEDKGGDVEEISTSNGDKTNDSGLSSENSNSSLEKDLKERKLEKFNLGEIVSFISSSWSSVSQDSSVSVFSASGHAHTDVSA